MAYMSYEDLLAHIQTFATIDWPEGEKYAEAECATVVATWLIQNRKWHEDLRDAKIKVLFKKDLGSRGSQVVLGRASVQNELQRTINPEVEFVLQVNWKYWEDLGPDHKVILIDHELCHMQKMQTEKGTKYSAIPHDLEEFVIILKTYGDKKVLDFHNLTGLMLQQKKDAEENGQTDAGLSKEEVEGLDILDEG